MQALEHAVQNIRMPSAPAVDLAPLQRRVEELDRSIKAIAIPTPREVDLLPVQERLTALASTVQAIRLPAPQMVDLSNLQARLNGIDESVRSLRSAASPAAAPVDLAPTQRRLDAIEQALRAIQIPPATSVDLSPVLQKLAALEARATQPAPAPAGPARVAAPAAGAGPAAGNPVVRSGSRNLLARAAYGEPDDLKVIKGVATVLEKMLHKIGVYYFWQIAEWSAKDVAHANDQLAAFKGRISRDQWVKQAVVLARAPHAARKPAGF